MLCYSSLGKINSDLSCNRFCEFCKQFCLSCRWLGETEAPETEESKGWKEKGEEDWDGGKQETGEMWGFNSPLLIVFLKKLFFFFYYTMSNFLTQFRCCSWFVRVWLLNVLVCCSDPEVHIGLENLQHFPAFGSPPQSGSGMQIPEFLLGPPSPLSTSPLSGNTHSHWPSVPLSFVLISHIYFRWSDVP